GSCRTSVQARTPIRPAYLSSQQATKSQMRPHEGHQTHGRARHLPRRSLPVRRSFSGGGGVGGSRRAAEGFAYFGC
ncbi:MAG: hypothetical protein WCP12_05030, partial [bacterium]